MSAANIVCINGVNYPLSPLRCKHLKQISKILKEPRTVTADNVWDALSQWVPFIGESIRMAGHPEFKDEMLDEMTLTEFGEAWTKVTQISGVALVPAGETRPTAIRSTGVSSTPESAAQSDGPTLM